MKKKGFVTSFMKYFVFITLLGIFGSCEKEISPELQEESSNLQTSQQATELNGSQLKCAGKQILVSSELKQTLPAATIKALVGSTFAPLIKYGVKMYKVSYYTLYKNCPIIASGIVGIPDTTIDNNTTVVMYDHGTRITEADIIPSSGTDLISVVSAANGKICFAADYIGFGDTKNIFHPYQIIRESVYPACDMILAGREFLKEQFYFNPKPSITIFGFSQGGSITMAVQRELENNPYYRHQVQLKRVAMATGPYDLYNSVLIPILSQESYSQPSLLLFGFISYNNYYHVGFTLDQMFKNSYGQQFLDLVAQNKTSAEINAAFPIKISDLLQEDFHANFLAGRTPFNFLFGINTTYKGWIPKSPTRIYHSPVDEVVPYANAEIAYNTFINKGANTVELITLPPVSHVNSAFLAYMDIIQWIDSEQ